MEALAAVLLALGDDELILGHRHSEWTGYAPQIEEDVAFSSIAQDEIGHAAAYYALAAGITGDSPDDLAFGREPAEYRNAILCERPNDEWGYTLARHWVYDTADDVRLESLARSSHAELAQLATKIRREERYHLMHAEMWLERIARGPLEGRNKLVKGLAAALADAGGLFEALPEEQEALDQGVLVSSSEELGAHFLARAGETLDRFGLPLQASRVGDEAEFVASSSGDLIAAEGETTEAGATGDGTGGRQGKHTADLEELWQTMTRHYRENPGATW